MNYNFNKNWSSQYFVKLFVAQLRENMRNSGCLFDMRLILCRWLKNDQHSREMLPACSQEYLQREFVTNNTHYTTTCSDRGE